MDFKKKYTYFNAQTWDRWADEGNEWSIPITHEKYQSARSGDWDVVLTPCRPVPHSWFLPFENIKILGLASGGGQQIPIFTALGAKVTIFDLSNRQLRTEKLVAEREEYSIGMVKGDMTKPLPFRDDSFDLIFHPVSNCYVEEIQPIWHECYRILRKGGVLLAGLDNGINFLVEDDEEGADLQIVNKLPYNPLKTCDEDGLADWYAKNDGFQFSHTLEEQIGGQLIAGFTLTDLFEDRNNYGELAKYIPTFIATRAIK
ncbi:MAG: class I SAM-dependent methyltransferase [Flexilinea sp.]